MPSPAAADAFGAGLYASLGTRGNLAISPASLGLALRLALLGARSRTAAELAAALRLAGPEQAAAGLRQMSAQLNELAAGPVTLDAPAALWVQAGLPLRPGFTAALAGAAAVSVHAADFARAAAAARGEINALIAGQTAGKITGLIPPGAVDAATRAVLASAVYLRAGWARPFPAAATADGPFRPEPGREVTTALMRLSARLGYQRGDGYQVVELPYAGGQLAMLIVLPDGGLGGVEDRLAATGVAGLAGGAGPAGGPGAGPPGAPEGGTGAAPASGAASLRLRQVNLVLPRFRVTSALDLRAPLTVLGAGRMFGADADLSGITDAQPLRIGAVAHKAYIDVDERGTEAAAATAVVVQTRARALGGEPPVRVVVDRPFLYAIIATGSGLPLFLGRVTDPTAG